MSSQVPQVLPPTGGENGTPLEIPILLSRLLDPLYETEVERLLWARCRARST